MNIENAHTKSCGNNERSTGSISVPWMNVFFTNDSVRSGITEDNFYQTGYESIKFSGLHGVALETVLSSVVPFEKGAVLINSEEAVRTCEKHDIFYQSVKSHNGVLDWILLDKLQETGGVFSHICITLSDSHPINKAEIVKLHQLAERRNMGLIFICKEMSYNHDLKIAQIDFLIAEQELNESCALVLARRNKLVQTEGNARSSYFDLYRSWQGHLQNRRRHIEPMAV
jgi:hypothetical protein